MRRLLIGSFVISLSMGIAGLALPLYAKDLRASYTEIGLLGVAYVVFDAMLSIPVGRAADRRGRKHFIVVGFLATACVLLSYSLVSTVMWLILIRLIHGVAEAPIWVNVQSAVAEFSPSGGRGRAMGAYGTSWASGIGIGPIIGGVLYVSVGAAGTFLVSAIIAFVATAIVATVSLPKPEAPPRKVNLSPIWPACFAGLIYVGLVSLLFTILPVYTTRGLGMSEFHVGVLIALFTCSRAILFIPFGGLSDIFGHRPIILVGIFGSSLASAAIALVSGYATLAIMVSVLAVAEGAVYPAVVSTISKAGGGRNFGFLLGVFNAIAMVGWAVFPGIGGVLADSYGATSPFLMFAVVGLISIPLLWRLLPKK